MQCLFQMAINGDIMKEVTCNKCGRVHVAIPRSQMIEQNISESDIDHCFGCGNYYTNFRLAKDEDAPIGVTLQAVLDFEEANT